MTKVMFGYRASVWLEVDNESIPGLVDHDAIGEAIRDGLNLALEETDTILDGISDVSGMDVIGLKVMGVYWGDLDSDGEM